MTTMVSRVQSRASKAAARPGQSLLPPAPPPDATELEPRASKRKRRPTAALLEALAEDDDMLERECVTAGLGTGTLVWLTRDSPRRVKLSHGGDLPPGINLRYDLLHDVADGED